VARSLEVAIDDWGCNLIRLPMSQDRWFGLDPTQRDGGETYRAIIDGLVTAAARRGVYLILDLHWSNAGACGQFIGQHRMPGSGTLLFWQDVARAMTTILRADGLYNEPHDIDWRSGSMEANWEKLARRAARSDGAAEASPNDGATASVTRNCSDGAGGRGDREHRRHRRLISLRPGGLLEATPSRARTSLRHARLPE
jgi:aryl-phospho-beta-D-glucosidase BglC (GH1 family)